MRPEVVMVRIPRAHLDEFRAHLAESPDIATNLIAEHLSDTKLLSMLSEVGLKAIRGEYEAEYSPRFWERINRQMAEAIAEGVAALVPDVEVGHDTLGWPCMIFKLDDGKRRIAWEIPPKLARLADRTTTVDGES